MTWRKIEMSKCMSLWCALFTEQKRKQLNTCLLKLIYLICKCYFFVTKHITWNNFVTCFAYQFIVTYIRGLLNSNNISITSCPQRVLVWEKLYSMKTRKKRKFYALPLLSPLATALKWRKHSVTFSFFCQHVKKISRPSNVPENKTRQHI